jgi:LysR family nitrogen assimilation transcriptional regulator
VWGVLRAVQIVRPGIRRTIALSLATHRPMPKAARFVATRVRQLASQILRG